MKAIDRQIKSICKDYPRKQLEHLAACQAVALKETSRSSAILSDALSQLVESGYIAEKVVNRVLKQIAEAGDSDDLAKRIAAAALASAEARIGASSAAIH